MRVEYDGSRSGSVELMQCAGPFCPQQNQVSVGPHMRAVCNFAVQRSAEKYDAPAAVTLSSLSHLS